MPNSAEVAKDLRDKRPDPRDASYMQWRNDLIRAAMSLEAQGESFDLDEFYNQAGRADDSMPSSAKYVGRDQLDTAALDKLVVRPRDCDGTQEWNAMAEKEEQMNALDAYAKRWSAMVNRGLTLAEATQQLEREHQLKLITDMLHRTGRNFLPQILHTLHPLLLKWDLPSKEYWMLVRQAWTGCEWPLEWLHPKSWQTLFRHDYAQAMMEETERIELAQLAEIFTVWRGVANMGKDWRTRMHWSWTLDKDRAIWFATRLGGDKPMLMQQRIRKADAFALLDARGEKEILLPFMKLEPKFILTSYL